MEDFCASNCSNPTYQPLCSKSNACTTSVEECSWTINSDFDWYPPCYDPDCAGTSYCTEFTSETNCSDGLDNDYDGKIDCADDECENSSTCTTTITEICNDNIDNDNNGLIDCTDLTCASASNCIESLWWGTTGWWGTDIETNCTDWIDNDNNGLIDMYDPGCGNDNDDNWIIDVCGVQMYSEAFYAWIPWNMDTLPKNAAWEVYCHSDVNVAALKYPLGQGPLAPYHTISALDPTLQSTATNFYTTMQPLNLLYKNHQFGDDWYNLTNLIFTDLKNIIWWTTLNMHASHYWWLLSTANNTWWTGTSNAVTQVITEKSEELISWASFLIEIDPSVWTLQSPWASEFMKEVDVFK